MPTGNDEEMAAWKEAGYPTRKVIEPTECYEHVDTLAEADGIYFKCPACGGHMVAPTFAGRNVASHLGSHGRGGEPTRWNASGSGYDDLTLTPSIDLSGPRGPACQWHGFVTNGVAT